MWDLTTALDQYQARIGAGALSTNAGSSGQSSSTANATVTDKSTTISSPQKPLLASILQVNNVLKICNQVYYHHTGSNT